MLTGHAFEWTGGYRYNAGTNCHGDLCRWTLKCSANREKSERLHFTSLAVHQYSSQIYSVDRQEKELRLESEAVQTGVPIGNQKSV